MRGGLVAAESKARTRFFLRFTLIAAFIATCGHAHAQVRIGLVAPLSGPAAPLGDSMRKAAEDVVDSVNRSGGVAGQKVNLVVYDDSCQPSRSVEHAQRLRTENVLAVVGHCPAAAQQVRQVYESNRIPLFMPNTTLRNLGNQGSRYVFHIGAREDRLGEAAYDAIRQSNAAGRIVVLTDGTQIAAEVAAQIKQRGNVVADLDLRAGDV